ncbi:MAG: hypothetical protein Q8R25_01190 [bacterium]|nr:hypothetical protein [bacterium]
MTLDEFAARLDPNNPFTPDLVEFFQRHPGFVLERKGSNLVDKFFELEAKKRHPVVDKKLQMLFGVGGGDHEMVRAHLYTYHEAKVSSLLDMPDFSMGAAWDMTDNLGDYLSSLRSTGLIVPHGYRPDRFDKDLFLLYKIQYDSGAPS